MRGSQNFITLASVLLFAHAATGDSLTFAYSDPFAGLSFKGSFTGTLLEDKNTFAIKGIDSFTYAIDPKLNSELKQEPVGSWDLPAIFGGDYYWSNKLTSKAVGDEIGSVTLDGSHMNLAACTDAKCSLNSFSILGGDGFDDTVRDLDQDMEDGMNYLSLSILSDKPISFNAGYCSTSKQDGKLSEIDQDTEKKTAELKAAEDAKTASTQSGSGAQPQGWSRLQSDCSASAWRRSAS
jgi:hypothetical protein